MNYSIQLNKANTIEKAAEIVTNGTCEGVEGVEFTPEQLAGQYAYDAQREMGEPVTDDGSFFHLECLENAGAKFDFSEAMIHAEKLENAQ